MGALAAVCLAMLLDVSGSVSIDNYRLQRDGTAAALRAPQVQRAARDGGMRVTVIMWGSQTKIVVPWQNSPAQAADLLETIERPESGSTNVTRAIRAGIAVFEGQACERRVIDISGDGEHNAGAPEELAGAVAEALAAEIEVNALPILTAAEPNIVEWYRRNVTEPAGGFVVPATWEGFVRALRNKLVLEIARR